MAALPWLIASYLLGAVPTSYLAARLFRGIDLREHGSRNLGATNLYWCSRRGCPRQSCSR